MDDQELILRCQKHKIPYASLPRLIRQELTTLVTRSDGCEDGADFLLDCLTQHADDCHIITSTTDMIRQAIADLLVRVSEHLTVFLSSFGNMGYTVSFSLTRMKPNRQFEEKLLNLKRKLSEENHAIVLITQQLYQESAMLLQGEQHCMNCRITDQVLEYVVTLSEVQDPSVCKVLSERKAFLEHCEERRLQKQHDLEQLLCLCVETIPAMLTQFQEQSAALSAQTLSSIIRACESLRAQANSLHSLLISQIHS